MHLAPLGPIAVAPWLKTAATAYFRGGDAAMYRDPTVAVWVFASVAAAVIAALVLARVWRRAPDLPRTIDVGSVSESWIAAQRAESQDLLS